MLRLTTGVPLFLGIVIVVAVSMHLMTSNATGWMAPVVTSLESEETSSLQRLAVAQAGFAEEVVAQMFDEINLAQDYATKILSNDFVKTSGAMPVDAYHYTLPLSVDSVGVLEYDKNKITKLTAARDKGMLYHFKPKQSKELLVRPGDSIDVRQGR